MKVVAVSQRVDIYPERNERRDALDQRLAEFLLFIGLLPVPVPNALFLQTPNTIPTHNNFDAWMTAMKPKGIVLSGGNDIGECPERDQLEYYLLDYAQRQHLPVLGICRGMQMMATWAGTELKTVKGHVRSRHRLSGAISGEANSFHALALSNCPSGFSVIAHSEDGEIEAIRHNTLPWSGWMWHPERESSYQDRDIKQLKELFA